MKPEQDIHLTDERGIPWLLHAGCGATTIEEAKKLAEKAGEQIVARAHQVPPWEEFPNIKRGCMGWRMGDGDTFLLAWMDRWQEMTDEQRKEYHEKWPVPESWEYPKEWGAEGFYEFVTRMCDDNI
jgi:hypothetical protein